MEAQSAALAAKAARDMVRRKSLLSSTVLPGERITYSKQKIVEIRAETVLNILLAERVSSEEFVHLTPVLNTLYKWCYQHVI